MKECAICQRFYTPRRGAHRTKFCSNACKQKSYREERAKREKAKLQIVTMDELIVRNMLTNAGFTPAVERMDQIERQHGREVIREVVWLLRYLMIDGCQEENQHHA